LTRPGGLHEGAIAFRRHTPRETDPVDANDRTRKELVRQAARMFGGGSHCSEIVFLLAMKAWARQVDPDLVRMASGFGGGIGEGGDLCGCVTGGVMAIGLLHGRTEVGEDDPPAYGLSRAFRDRFVEANGFLQCRDYTGGVFNRQTRRKCTQVVMRALDILLDILAENRSTPSHWARDELRPFVRPTGP